MLAYCADTKKSNWHSKDNVECCEHLNDKLVSTKCIKIKKKPLNNPQNEKSCSFYSSYTNDENECWESIYHRFIFYKFMLKIL